MPIHQTKLMIAKPQPTGELTPQMPTPLMTRCVIATSSISDIAPVMPIAIHQPSGARFRRTIELILSVTEVSV